MESERGPQINVSEKESPKPRFKNLIHLYVVFAEAVAAKTGKTLPEVLLHNTPLFRRFGLGNELDPENRVWKEYITGLETHPLEKWTYEFYSKRRKTIPTPHTTEQDSDEKNFGCFSFNPIHINGIQIHFDNKDTSGLGPLSDEQQTERFNELKKMFAYIKTHFPQAERVYGGSWLYNLERYRRLFPPSYTKEVKEVVQTKKFTSSSKWGQFLDSKGGVKQELAQELIENLEEVLPDELSRAFPYPTLKVSGPLSDFYEFYGLTQPTPPQTSEGS